MIVDLARTRHGDHTVMTKLDELKRALEQDGLKLQVTGLDSRRAMIGHPHAGRKQAAPPPGQ